MAGDIDAYSIRQRRRQWALLPLALLVAAVALWALNIGPDRLPFGAVWSVLCSRFGGPHGSIDPLAGAIVWELRAPRVALGLLVGAALAGSGAVYQGLFRNPMADPFPIGVSSGAALGAVIQITLREQIGLWTASAHLTWAAPLLLSRPLFAFCLAILTVLIVYRIALRGGRVESTTLLLTGLAMSSFLTAFLSMLLVFASNGQKLTEAIFWLMGGLQDRSWADVRSVFPWVLGGLAVMMLLRRPMNLALLGEETSQQLGVSPEVLRRWLLTAATLATAAAVSFSGIIGFVGLIVPHGVRLLWGPDHRNLVPASILAGAGFLVLADALARSLLSPQEIPVGIITALTGAPFFLLILRRGR